MYIQNATPTHKPRSFGTLHIPTQHSKEPEKPLKSTDPKYENNWQEKSIEKLEKDFWREPGYESHLVKTCHQLRKKPLKDFEIEDLRIMIGQNIGLKFFIPLALEKLRENILAEGDFYEGDLLKSVLKSEVSFWEGRADLFEEFNKVIQQNLELLDQNIPELKKEFESLKSILR
jgi:hypothetical protein